ncbi:uncharacterized protein hdac12 isoform X3 [Entelurus aequoreus]|uniref:uncharacterized protein hdac12 isoform X3 n=1 Tax=Entelurus aequoreus TaxID=161455 RepID=UPI002B1E698B|nr:uncharacterized protein hdac12 isoform X3 [Entelurus aequoreus]
MTCMNQTISKRSLRVLSAAATLSQRCLLTIQVRQKSNGLPIVHHSEYVCELPANHRFPMAKFPRVLHFLIKDQVISDKQVWTPEMASVDLLRGVHTDDYLEKFINGKVCERDQRRTGFPWSEGIVAPCWRPSWLCSEVWPAARAAGPITPFPAMALGSVYSTTWRWQHGTWRAAPRERRRFSLWIWTCIRVTAPLSSSKTSHVSSPSRCIVGKTFLSANNTATSMSALRMAWRTRSISPQWRLTFPGCWTLSGQIWCFTTPAWTLTAKMNWEDSA